MVWVFEGKVDGVISDDFDLYDDCLFYLLVLGSEYLMYSMDSRYIFDYEDIDIEGGVYID